MPGVPEEAGIVKFVVSVPRSFRDLSRKISHNSLFLYFVPNHRLKVNPSKMTYSTPVKIVVSVLAMAALVATRVSFNKVSEM
jgi:hypothetical protein